jgi:hypothetical protein
VSREESWSQLARHLRWCSECHWESSWSNQQPKCATLRRLWTELMGNIDPNAFEFYMDPPHPEAQPLDVGVFTGSFDGHDCLMLTVKQLETN